MNQRLLFIVNVDWFFVSHRLPIAQAAIKKGYEVHLATRVTDKRTLLESSGIIVHEIGLERAGINPIKTAWYFLQILYVLMKIRPDITHVITIKPTILGGLASHFVRPKLLVAAVSGLGTVFVAEGPLARARRLFITLLYRIAFAHQNLTVIFQNHDDQYVIQKITHVPKSRCVTIRGSGVDLDKFVPTPLPDGPPIVMFAARLLGDKGIREFVNAAQSLKQNYRFARQGVRFVLVGSDDPGNVTSVSEAELKHWKAAQGIELWGHCSDMRNALAKAYLVVLPSYREGLPKVLIEAAACGRAVVTTDVPGCRDAVEPGKSGLLVPVKDHSALADAIQFLLDNPDKVKKMGQNGRTLAEKSFDIDMVIAQHLNIYEHTN